jgi:hypothetical protein
LYHHQNSWGPYLIQALRNLDCDGISASSDDYSGMSWNLAGDPIQLPEQATTSDGSDTKNDFVSVPILSDCSVAADHGEVFVRFVL